MGQHQYTDDTQLFQATCASSIRTELSKLEMCTCDIKCWFPENDLLLYADKSEVDDWYTYSATPG